MTRDEILAMEAGRELDALVAEKVMGYTLSEKYSDSVCYVEWKEEPYSLVHRPFNPSSNISIAWEVLATRQYDYFVKHMSKTGMFEVVIDHVIPAEEGKREWRHFTRAIAKSAPEAISKAALLAVMDA